MPLSPVNSSGQRFTSEQFFRLYIPHRGELEFYAYPKRLPAYLSMSRVNVPSTMSTRDILLKTYPISISH